MFYGGGLWGYFNQSCLDNLFSKNDFKIEDLLDEDNIINDVKINQNKFADFMIKNPQYIQEMIKYAITMPSIDDDEKKKHKYPFISSELLGIQIQKLQEFIFQSLETEDQHQLSEAATDENKSLNKSVEEKKPEQDSEESVPKEISSESNGDASTEKEGEDSTKTSSEETADTKGDKENSSENKPNEDEVKEETANNAKDDEWDDDDISSKSHDEVREQVTSNKQSVKGIDLLNTLFSFLDTDSEVDSTSAGFFNKIVMHLISSREGYLWRYLKFNPKIIENMMKHFYLKSVSKIVYFLIAQDGADLDPDTFIEQRVDLVKKLHQKFRESDDHEVLLNIQEIFVQVNSTSIRPQSFEVKRQLYSLDSINILLESIENHKESFSQASLVLSSYLDHYRQTIYNDNTNEDTDNFCSDGLNFGRKNDEAIAKEFPLEYIQSKTSCLIKALMEENFNVEVPKHETQYGSLVQPYGLNRVKLLHLILCLLKTENTHVNNAIVENGFFSYLLNLIIKHEWNNILHNQIEQIYNESFMIAMKNEKVREAIINDAKFLDFLVQNGKTMKTQPGTSKNQITKGYVCMVVSFANQIENQKENLQWLQDAVNNTEGWSEFVNGSLKSVNDLHKRDLGNEDPRKRKESEDSIPNNDLSIQEIYMKFRNMYTNRVGDEPKNQNDDSDDDDDEEVEKNEVVESPEQKPEPKQEVQDDLGYDSINFWKLSINYDVDALMKDL